MEILQLVAFEIALPLGFVALFHFILSKYPEPLPIEQNKQRGIWESLILWALVNIVFSAIILSGFVGETTERTPALMLQIILITAVPFALIPGLYLRLVKNWTLSDFGFRMPERNSRAIVIVGILIFALAGALPLLDSDFVPVSVLMVLITFIQPAFYEEFFFRGIIQGNLERVLGQNKAWIYGGILFGLAHVIPNYFVQGFDLLPGIIQFVEQTIAGWMFGILYMKTRSLLPGILAHFLTNGTLASILALAF
jgi:membrane protease YdiL (CAAX protease family)